MEPSRICHIVTPVGCMGYGFDENIVARELAQLAPSRTPTAIILDAGSTDSGPEKLALGTMTCPRSAYVKDLTKLLRLVHAFQVPLIFSSAGGDGADEHVRLMEEIIQEISSEETNQHYSFKTVSIFSSIDKSVILERLGAGRITGCGVCVPALTEKDVTDSPRVVAQIGPEPFIDAMEATPDFDVIIGGRAYDPTPYVAFSVYQLRQQHPDLGPEQLESIQGGLLHMGKIMECGGQCSTPKSHGAVATVYADGTFDVRPMAPGSRCTPVSVAAHSLYENTRPDILRGPGGALHLDQARYEQLGDGRTVRVRGGRFVSSASRGQPYQLKLEAARVLGYRSIVMGSIRDHILVQQLDSFLVSVKGYVKQQHSSILGDWDLDFHVYGKGQSTLAGPGEVFLVAEAVAPTQQLATGLVSTARVAMIHGPYPGQKATSGNLAFGLAGKLEIETGPCAQFSVYHLMDLEAGEERLSHQSRLICSKVSVFEKAERAENQQDLKNHYKVFEPVPSTPSGKETSTSAIASQESASSHPPETLSDISRVLRSKNAGPYEITMDVMFESQAVFDAVEASGLLSPANVAEALRVRPEDIVWSGFFAPALAFKVTIPRFRAGKMASAGSFMENDIHGSQQHLGLSVMKLPPGLMS
ncbi:Putative acyclic terpene utilization [Colletotrichum destructivum]|uniref:Acyclic terpene utilization n=1 Tax=Colletotrichum destructivum TaxID=34406 RepID=A0AAX4J3R6_9PEZI|nr:Putative acyclic terpene utilization [Colletotrichum destructivum]